jgi:hypothetical protein
MALIDLSDWLDRFGAASSRGVTPSEVEAIRIVAHEMEASQPLRKEAAPEPLRVRWSRLWRRSFRRLGRQPRGAT